MNEPIDAGLWDLTVIKYEAGKGAAENIQEHRDLDYQRTLALILISTGVITNRNLRATMIAKRHHLVRWKFEFYPAGEYNERT